MVRPITSGRSEELSPPMLPRHPLRDSFPLGPGRARQDRAITQREQVQQDCSREGPPNLLNDLVGAGEQRGRYIESERDGSRQIDDEIELGRLLDRDFGGLCSA